MARLSHLPTSFGSGPRVRAHRIHEGNDVPHDARTSMGSPSAVPVPCASNAGPWQVPCPALTVSISRCCDDPLGAVRLALGPSYCTAVPHTLTSSDADVK